MPYGYARYGLKENPFSTRLEPLVQAQHGEWLVRVDGFRKLDEIDAYLKLMAPQEKPLFFLVTGRNGAGRTCVADYILARYRHYRGIPAERFIVPNREVDNHDVFETFQNWLIFLYNELDALVPHVNLAANLLDRITAANDKTMEAIFQGLLLGISNQLKNAKDKTGFGCCLEDAPTNNFVNAAYKVFQKTQTVCIFTAKDYEEWQKSVIQPFKHRASGLIIELSPLIGQHARMLIEERWQQATKTIPCPFDSAGLAEAFDKNQWPVARVLRVVSLMLDLKVPIHIEGALWPEAADLGFSRADLDYLVDKLGQE